MTPSTEADRTSELVRIFQQGKRTQRWQALCALQELGPEAALAVPDLIAALRDADLGFRTHTVLALVAIGADAVAPLLDALATDDEDLRKAIVVTLGRIGPPALPAVPTLTVLLEDVGMSTVARQALGRIQRGTTAELVPHFRRTFLLALMSSASLALLVGCVVLLSRSGEALQAGGPMAAAVALALGVFCGGMGAVLGGHSWGRGGAVGGLICCGLAGYVLGRFMGGFAEVLLAPLLRVLGHS